MPLLIFSSGPVEAAGDGGLVRLPGHGGQLAHRAGSAVVPADLLGFAADLPVHVVVRSQLPFDRVGGLVCPARPVNAAPLADVGVILASTVDPARFPAGVRAVTGLWRCSQT